MNIYQINFVPGQVLETDIGLVKHVGIYTGYSVISCSRRKGMACEETLEEFSQGNAVRASQWKSNLNPALIILNARSLIGQPYSVLNNNCEHFVSKALGYSNPISPQLNAVSFLVFGLAAVYTLKNA